MISSATEIDPGRPPEIEGLSNKLFIHAASGWLVPHLQRLGVHPNLVSLTGLMLGLGAAPMYIYLPHPLGALGVLLCFILWLICDGADGKLARATGKASAAGHVIDGIADYSVFVAYYTVMAFYAEPRHGAAILWITAAAGASHIIQAASFEAERERYKRWTNLPANASPSDPAAPAPPFPLSLLKSGYEWLQRCIQGELPERGQISATQEAVAAAYRRHFTTLVRRWGIISSNGHALAIFLFALAGAPEGYFLFEIIAFNLCLIILVIARRKAVQNFNLSLAESPQNIDKQKG